MFLVLWAALGIVAGALFSFVAETATPKAYLLDVLAGAAGAVLGGFLAAALGFGSPTEFNFVAVLFAVAAAVLVLFAKQKTRKWK